MVKKLQSELFVLFLIEYIQAVMNLEPSVQMTVMNSMQEV